MITTAIGTRLVVSGGVRIRRGIDVHRLGSFLLGNGSRIARTNTATMRRITTRFATEI